MGGGGSRLADVTWSPSRAQGAIPPPVVTANTSTRPKPLCTAAKPLPTHGPAGTSAGRESTLVAQIMPSVLRQRTALPSALLLKTSTALPLLTAAGTQRGRAPDTGAGGSGNSPFHWSASVHAYE
jgi:hypothetical protein